MNRIELQAEIIRVRNILAKTHNSHVRNDYGKYLRKLERDARDYDSFKRGELNVKTKNRDRQRAV